MLALRVLAKMLLELVEYGLPAVGIVLIGVALYTRRVR